MAPSFFASKDLAIMMMGWSLWFWYIRFDIPIAYIKDEVPKSQKIDAW